jgi:hypothetical protein
MDIADIGVIRVRVVSFVSRDNPPQMPLLCMVIRRNSSDRYDITPRIPLCSPMNSLLVGSNAIVEVCRSVCDKSQK